MALPLPGQLPPPPPLVLTPNGSASATTATSTNNTGSSSTPPVVQPKAPKSEFKRLTKEWNETHEKLTENFRELNVIFADIKFLLQQLESQLEAAGIKSDLSHCVSAADSCIESFVNANANASSLDMHINNLDKNVFNNPPQDIQETFKKLTKKVAEAGNLGRDIGIPRAAQNTSATQSTQPSAPTSTVTQSTQSAQPLSPSQSNLAQIQQLQQYFQTSSTNLQRNLSDIDLLEQNLQRPYYNGASVDIERNALLAGFNSATSALDQCDQSIQTALSNFRQAQPNNQSQAQQAWAQVRSAQTSTVLHVEGELIRMSDHIDNIDSLISSITSDLLSFTPHLTAVSNSTNVFKSDFLQKCTDFSNLNQQMQLSVLSQNDSQQLLQIQQSIQSLATSENDASQRMQNLISNYQTMQANLAAHTNNRNALRQSHKDLVAKVRKIKDDLINNP
jgi:hypothetical protein